MIKYVSGGKGSFAGKKVAISGSGNVAQYAALKVIELGGTVVSLSDSKGTIVAEAGITPAQINTIAALKVDRKQLTEFKADKVVYHDGVRPWTKVGAVDVALPCATQNEVSSDEAKALIAAGAKFIAEGSNMGCSQEAIEIFEEHRRNHKADAIWYAPGKSCLFPVQRELSSRALTADGALIRHLGAQAKLLTREAWPCPALRWRRTRSVCRGRRRRSTAS